MFEPDADNDATLELAPADLVAASRATVTELAPDS
jgi:hypothetical protein